MNGYKHIYYMFWMSTNCFNFADGQQLLHTFLREQITISRTTGTPILKRSSLTFVPVRMVLQHHHHPRTQPLVPKVNGRESSEPMSSWPNKLYLMRYLLTRNPPLHGSMHLISPLLHLSTTNPSCHLCNREAWTPPIMHWVPKTLQGCFRTGRRIPQNLPKRAPTA